MVPIRILAALVVALGSARGLARAEFNGTTSNELGCPVRPIDDLGPECRPFVVYNQLEWSRKSTEEALELARTCACQMVNLDWELAFEQHPSVHRVRAMVRGVLGMAKYADKEHHYPPQLWSDTDTIMRGYSIYLSTRDFFNKKRLDDSWSWLKKADFQRHVHLRDTRHVCFQVATDERNYYQYLENLQRVQPIMFFQLLRMNEVIDLIYQASKACKLFLLHRLNEFQLRPTMGDDFYAVREVTLKPKDLAALNELTGSKGAGLDEHFDEALRDASVELTNCPEWQRERFSLERLQIECPMMMSDATPNEWFERHPDAANRSQAALKCGCQLLLHNETWPDMVADPSVQVMSETLANYMRLHPLPGRDSGPRAESALQSTREYFGWFESVMDKFAKNKRVAVKEVVKFKRLSEDPTNEINAKTNDEDQALELLRLGCNRVVFNYQAKRRGEPKQQTGDMRLIQYLDNLRYISQDPLFVFHLTLQNANLFKIYALSRVCEPFIR